MWGAGCGVRGAGYGVRVVRAQQTMHCARTTTPRSTPSMLTRLPGRPASIPPGVGPSSASGADPRSYGPNPDAAERERLVIVRRSSRRAHSWLRRGQPVVATRKKAKSSEAPPSSPGCPSPFFTVLFLDANWGWQSKASRRRSSSKRRCRWSLHVAFDPRRPHCAARGLTLSPDNDGGVSRVRAGAQARCPVRQGAAVRRCGSAASSPAGLQCGVRSRGNSGKNFFRTSFDHGRSLALKL